MTEIWLAFLAGVAGSVHCLGMCGGIVAALAMSDRTAAPVNRLLFQLLYNLGRIATYTLLGVTAGIIGSSLDILTIKEVSLWVMAAANLLVTLVGLAACLGSARLGLFALEGSGGRLLARPLRWVLSGNSPVRALLLGLVLGFLPCGLVYAPLVAAAGCGNPLRGGAILAAMGLGTLPLLLIFGSASVTITDGLRDGLFRIAGLLVALIGTAGLWRVLAKMGLAPGFPFW
jgi:uncharacterized protein